MKRIKEKLTESKHALHRTFESAAIYFKGKAELDDALVDAVIFDRLDEAKKLLNRGADPNADNGFAICLAVSKQNVPMLTALLKTGKAGCSAEAPLRIAITENLPVMAYKLIENGASFERAEAFVAERGNAFEVGQFNIFREKYATALARVERHTKARVERKTVGPKHP